MRAVIVALAVAAIAAAPRPPLTPGQFASLRERDRLWASAGKAWKAGNQADALALMKKALAAEMRILGPWHRDTELTADTLGDWHQERGEWAEEAGCRRIVLEARTRLFGESHHRTFDARLELTEALAQQKRPPARQRAIQQARAMSMQALALDREGKPAEALPLAREAADAYRVELGTSHPLHAAGLDFLGMLHQALGEHDAALPLLRKALSLREAVLPPGHPRIADTMSNLGGLHHLMGNHRAALPLLVKALALTGKALGQRDPSYATSLNNLATLYVALGDHDAALPLFRQSLALARDVLGEKHPQFAHSLFNLASLLGHMGNHAEALHLLRRAVTLTGELKGHRHPAYAKGLNNLAFLLVAAGDHKAALPLYIRAIKLQRDVLGTRHPDLAESMNNLASLHHDLGDFKAALHLCLLAMQIRKDTLGAKHPSYAASLTSLAMIHSSMGNRRAALPLLEQALAVREAALGRKHPGIVDSLNNLALLHTGMENHDAALPQFEKALALARDIHGDRHPTAIICLGNLASAHSAKGDTKAALPLARRALALTREVLGEKHPDHATIQNNLAFLLSQAGDDRAALPLAEQSIAATRSHLHAMATMQSDRQQLASVEMYRHHLDVRLSIADGPKHLPAAAHALAWKGALLIRQQQRRLFVRLAASADTKEAALRLQEATRRLAALRLSGSASRKKLDTLSDEQEAAQAELARLSEAFGAAREAERPSTDVVSRVLPEGAALVDYHFYWSRRRDAGKPVWSRRLVAFVHRKDKPPTRVDLEADAARIERAIGVWRPLLMDGKHGRAEGAALASLVWKPLARHLEGAKVILISPDDALGTVPFAAFPGRKEGGFLVEDVALAVMPVPQAIPELMKPVPKKDRLPPSLLAVGGVDYDRTVAALADPRGVPAGVPREWGSLPGSAAEARAVARSFAARFKGGLLTELSGDKATTSAVRAALAKARHAHLATHGYFAPETVARLGDKVRPGGPSTPSGWHPLLLSGLAFAGANRVPKSGEEDGILTALEVSEMDLTKLELAVLSACETGLGKVAGGEGILGMQRAFQIAGARSVVASLWKVDDRATQQLMTDFYSIAWDAKKAVSLAEALRKAQLAMMFGKSLDGKPRGLSEVPEKIEMGKGGRLPPYYWAAFVLSGDWR